MMTLLKASERSFHLLILSGSDSTAFLGLRDYVVKDRSFVSYNGFMTDGILALDLFGALELYALFILHTVSLEILC